MNTKEKEQIVQQIIEKSKNYAEIVKQYSERINKINNCSLRINSNCWQSQFEKAKNNIKHYPELIKKLQNIVLTLQNDKGKDLTIQYLNLLNSGISSDRSIKDLKHLLRFISQDTNKINNANIVENFGNILNILDESISKLLKKLTQLDHFEYFKNIEHSIVIIGANGSGKSSFSRETKKVLGEYVVILAAQKIFAYDRATTISTGSNDFQAVHDFQFQEKLGRSLNHNSYISDLVNLMGALIAEHNQNAHNYYSNSKRKTSILEKAITLWNEIITHRFMKYEMPDIKIYIHKGEFYDFSSLSDGEKAIFYYIAHILIAKDNSYIIVDEPENHLHVENVSKLWNKLETLRNDCKFIYLTHNLDFASSRINSTKLWSKSFIPPAKWDMVLLPVDEDLPEMLLMEILGSRKQILFCEGEKSSLDYKLYTLVFPHYTVKPVGGHIKVINFTRAFNKSTELFKNTAVGIIDGDFHSESAKEKWEKDSIYCLDVQEVENILCDEMLLKAGKLRFCCPEGVVEKAKSKLFEDLSKKKESKSVEYAKEQINNVLKDNLIKKANSKNELKEQANNVVEKIKIDIEMLVSKREELFDKIIQEKDFDSGIKHFNNKGLISIVGNEIVKDYRNRILVLLESNTDLLEKLKKKYFLKILKTGAGAPNE